MIRVYLKEEHYFTLHLLKNAENVTGQAPTLNIMRNSDNKFLNTDDSTWDDEPFDIDLTETTNGIYQVKIDISVYYNQPESYTGIYNVTINDVVYTNSEQLVYTRQNRARLV